MNNINPPIVYQANPTTGEYAGQSYADPDPVDEGAWLIPGMAFTDAPPKAKKGFAVVHVPGEKVTWSLLKDVRGVVYQVETGLPVFWDQFGPIPETLTVDPRPGPYHMWVDGAWALDSAAETAALKIQTLDARDGLIRQATTRIAPLQDAVDLGDATPEDEAALKKWKQYRVAVNRIDQQPGFPTTIDWPAAPS